VSSQIALAAGLSTQLGPPDPTGGVLPGI